MAPQQGVGVQRTADTDPFSSYQSLRDRFNERLSGRYPFGELAAPDADLFEVKTFLADYAAHATALKSALGMSTEPRAAKALKFLAHLDKSAAFLSTSLLAGNASQPLILYPSFRQVSMASYGSEHLASWRLSSGQRASLYPGSAATSVDWSHGEAIEIELTWARGSPWRPTIQRSAATPNYIVDGSRASFSAGGAWALLRLIEMHQPDFDPESVDAARVVLEFRVATRRLNSADAVSGELDEMRLMLGLRLVAVNPKTKAEQTLVWPGGFVRWAP